MKAYIPNLDIEEEVTEGYVYLLIANDDFSTFTAYTQDGQNEVYFQTDSMPNTYFSSPITDLYAEDEDAWEDEAKKQLDAFFGTHVQASFVGADEASFVGADEIIITI